MFVILTMMCSTQVKANTLMLHSFIWVTTNVDNDLHLAEATIWKAPSGYCVFVGCQDIGEYTVCYWSIDLDNYSYYFNDVCNTHNCVFPNNPKMYYHSLSIIDYYNADV